MSQSAEPIRRTIYNDDSQGVHEARPDHAEADLRAWVDKVIDNIPVDVYSWCIAFPDIVHYNSKVGEVMGDRFPEPPNNASAVIRALRAEGTDVMKVVANQLHKRNTLIVAGVRMNDTHERQPKPASAGVSRLLLEHPEYAIRRSDGIQETALDYDIPAVREHRLAILRELAENYDVDGVELDFTRWGKHFIREQAPFKVNIMTAFVEEVRTILDRAAGKRNCDHLILGVQVPRSLYLSHLAGLDPKAWVKNGYLDYIIQCDHNCTDMQIPVAEFAEFCKDSACTHHVRMGNMLGGAWRSKPFTEGRTTSFKGLKAYGGMVLETDEARATAANIYGMGGDGVGYWNICCNMGVRQKPNAHPERTREQFQQDMMDWAYEVADPARVWSGRRTYHFVPTNKKERPPIRNYAVNQARAGAVGEPVQIVLLSPETEGYRQIFRFLTAENGPQSKDVSATIRFRILQSTIEDQFTFDVNGVLIPSDDIRTEVVDDDELPYVWYEAAGIGSALRCGENELGVTPQKIPTRRTNLSPGSLYEEFPYLEELIVTADPC